MSVGRPRQFDREQALEALVNLFWTHGFDGTSIEQIVAATGMPRATLYSELGDKEGAFRAATSYYAEKSNRAIPALDPVDALKTLANDSIVAAFASDGPKGCFLLQASQHCTSLSPATKQLLAELIEQIDRYVLLNLRRAAKSGQLPGHLNHVTERDALLCLIRGIAASARMGMQRSQAEKVVALYFERLLVK